jgi:hypothetical protein
MLFDTPAVSDARPIALLKKAIVIVAVVFLGIGVISSHRAYYQVRKVELTSTDRVLRNGTVIQGFVVTSGRTDADLQIELIQAGHRQILATRHVTGNDFAFFDPRTQHASLSIVVTPEMISNFEAGLATVRATAFGRSQWTRVPPPVVREMEVEIPGPTENERIVSLVHNIVVALDLVCYNSCSPCSSDQANLFRGAFPTVLP